MKAQRYQIFGVMFALIGILTVGLANIAFSEDAGKNSEGVI
jgi:hypothetical protein